MKQDADVIVVGYGPVGQLLALRLGRAGHRVTVVERWPQLFGMPRAVHYDHEVARIFQSAGVGDAMQAISSDAPSEAKFLGVGRQVLLRVDLGGGSSQSGWRFANGFAQPELEAVLDAAVRELPNVEILQGWTAVELKQDDEGVELTVRPDAFEAGSWVRRDAETRSLRAAFVVGTDGANSFVRRNMRTDYTDLGFAFDWLVVNVKMKPGHSMDHLGIVNIADPRRPTTMVPGGRGRRRWEFMIVPGDDPETMTQPDTCWTLLAEWGVTPENAELERHAIYTFRGAWAHSWRDGRVLLAGDAAHLMPPFMGQGMCSGMRDAITLSWQLDLVLRGQSSEKLLDHYTTDRLPHVQAMIHGSIENGRVMCISDPEQAAQRDAGMLAARSNPNAPPPLPPVVRLGPGIVMEGNRYAGQLGFQGMVEFQGRTGLFDDVVGGGFTLIGTDFDPAEHLTEENRHFLASLGAKVAHVTPNDGPLRDIDGAYARWFGQQGFSVALCRPDFYQFAATSDCMEVNAMVGALQSKLGV